MKVWVCLLSSAYDGDCWSMVHSVWTHEEDARGIAADDSSLSVEEIDVDCNPGYQQWRGESDG